MVKNPSKEHWGEWKERTKNLDITTAKQKPIGTILKTTEKSKPTQIGHNIIRKNCKNCGHHKAVVRSETENCTKCKKAV